MTTTSYYPCPKCESVLKLVEHYYPRKGQNAFSLEFVVLTCENCGASGKGRSEGEALEVLNSKPQQT